MKKIVNILIAAGFILIIIGLIFKCEELNNELNEAKETIDIQASELIRCKEENDYLWSNYYMNVSNYEGYEYYE